ncbi:MAG: alcohol dehydrogenase catalytic domain-containing protein [Acidimicrobiales bacterium]
MRAAVCSGFGEPLQVEELVVRAPLEDEVVVRVTACAICHSDVAFIDGAWGGRLPAVYGHEAAGVVEQSGRAVTDLGKGDPVVVTLICSCGACERCRRGRPALCEAVPRSDTTPVLTRPGGEAVHQGMRTGAFAEVVSVHRSQVVPMPTGVPAESACLLACGVLTGVGAVSNTAVVEAGSTVVVLGAGGVGLNCVQGAVLAGADRIVAVDVVENKLAAAEAFGATETFGATGGDLKDAIFGAGRAKGADYVFVAAGVTSLIEQGARLLRRGGALVIVGIPPVGSSVSLDPLAISDGSLRILGTKMGDSVPERDIPRLAELYLSGRLKLDELISQRFRLDEINDAIASAKRGEQLRPVIAFP